MISSFILKIIGWKIVNDFPDLKKYIVIAAPHTSWVDFPIAILTRKSLRTKINFVGKASLFKFPFGFIFKALGGAPINRGKSNNSVDAIVQIFNSREEFRLGISPEGTRKKVTQWKTGFYYIALGAKVPIVMATLDFENKQVKISEAHYPTGNQEEDFKTYKAFFKGVKGKIPEYS